MYLTYTAPYDGVIDLSAANPVVSAGYDGKLRVKLMESGATVNAGLAVTKNNTRIWPLDDDPDKDGEYLKVTSADSETWYVFAPIENITVQEGDKIRFAVYVNSGVSTTEGFVQWRPVVTYTSISATETDWELAYDMKADYAAGDWIGSGYNYDADTSKVNFTHYEGLAPFSAKVFYRFKAEMLVGTALQTSARSTSVLFSDTAPGEWKNYYELNVRGDGLLTLEKVVNSGTPTTIEKRQGPALSAEGTELSIVVDNGNIKIALGGEPVILYRESDDFNIGYISLQAKNTNSWYQDFKVYVPAELELRVKATFSDGTDTALENTIPGDGVVKVKASVTHLAQAATQPVTVLVALFEEGRMTNVKVLRNEVPLAIGRTLATVADEEFVIDPGTETAQIKVFVWDGFENLRPLTKQEDSWTGIYCAE
jgi:hypothetical protein